eukprot:9479098-Pyramimonas_sp.AAC.1
MGAVSMGSAKHFGLCDFLQMFFCPSTFTSLPLLHVRQPIFHAVGTPTAFLMKHGIRGAL